MVKIVLEVAALCGRRSGHHEEGRRLDNQTLMRSLVYRSAVCAEIFRLVGAFLFFSSGAMETLVTTSS